MNTQQNSTPREVLEGRKPDEAIKTGEALSKHARRRLQRQPQFSGEHARKKNKIERYFDVVRGELSAENGERIVARRIENNFLRGGDAHPDGGYLKVNYHGAIKFLARKKRTDPKLPAPVQDARALLDLTERVVGV